MTPRVISAGKTLIVGLATLVVVLFAGAQTALVYFATALQSHHGIQRLDLERAVDLYAKRAAWGLNHDQLALSTNPNRCVSPNPEEDYLFGEVDSGLFSLVYRYEDKVLHVYEGEDVPSAPTRQNLFPVKIQSHSRVQPPWEGSKEYLERRGLSEIRVELGPSPCETFLGNMTKLLLYEFAFLFLPVGGPFCLRQFAERRSSLSILRRG